MPRLRDLQRSRERTGSGACPSQAALAGRLLIGANAADKMQQLGFPVRLFLFLARIERLTSGAYHHLVNRLRQGPEPSYIG